MTLRPRGKLFALSILGVCVALSSGLLACSTSRTTSHAGSTATLAATPTSTSRLTTSVPTTTATEPTSTSQLTTSMSTTTATEPTTVASTESVSQFHWPRTGLQPESVIQMLHDELGRNLVPLYLPSRLPVGFYVGKDFVIEKMGGGYLPNPHVWNQSLGERAGYGLTFTDGGDKITLWVNPAADAGEGPWQQTDVRFEDGYFFHTMDAPAFLQAMGDKGAVVVLDGPTSIVDKVIAVAGSLVRVE